MWKILLKVCNDNALIKNFIASVLLTVLLIFIFILLVEQHWYIKKTGSLDAFIPVIILLVLIVSAKHLYDVVKDTIDKKVIIVEGPLMDKMQSSLLKQIFHFLLFKKVDWGNYYFVIENSKYRVKKSVYDQFEKGQHICLTISQHANILLHIDSL